MGLASIKQRTHSSPFLDVGVAFDDSSLELHQFPGSCSELRTALEDLHEASETSQLEFVSETRHKWLC